MYSTAACAAPGRICTADFPTAAYAAPGHNTGECAAFAHVFLTAAHAASGRVCPMAAFAASELTCIC
jgi:hypothetical protein